MIYKILSSSDGLHEAATMQLADMPEHERYGPSMALEYGIFAMHFGFMCRDFVAHYDTPDPLFTVHHIGTSQ